MSRRIFAQRTTHPPTFKSREVYLERAGSFCSLLQEFSQKPWVTVVLGPGWLSDRDRADAMATILQRLARALHLLQLEPWLTALPDGADVEQTAHGYAADMVADRLSIAASASSKMSPAESPATSVSGPDSADAWVAKILVTSMLSANLYFTLRALEPSSAMHRFGHDEQATEQRGTTALWLHRQLTARVLDALRALERELGAETSGARALAARLLEGRDAGDMNRVTDRFLASFEHVIESMRITLDPPGGAEPRLASADVRALTELAWFSLSSFAEDTYPGWLDLLLELSQYDNPEHGFVGRPSFDNVTDAGEAIRARYQRLTSISWKRPHDPNRPVSSKIHHSVAKLLLAQSSLKDALGDAFQKSPPPAVAHVTAFDLELEMALLRTREPFRVIFPVHVLDTLNNLLHVRWFMLEVASNELDAVLRPDADAVQVLTGRSRELDKLSGPIVVRLSGCPLIELPPLAVDGELTSLGRQLLGAKPDGEGPLETVGDKAVRTAYLEGLRKREPEIEPQELERRIARQITIRHAVIVNEFDAMLQNAMDNLPWNEGSMLCRRLPIETVADDRGWRRFWMLLGVQVGDSAIRQRVSHVVSWYPGSDDRVSAKDQERPRSGVESSDGLPKKGASESGIAGPRQDQDAVISGLGVLVSRHVGHLEQDLLYWNRFDIVENAEAHLFSEDLDHIAATHLKESDRGAMIRCQGA